MIWVIAITATVLVLVGIAVLRGKCDEIIAGYSTASEEERQRYNMKRFRRVVASVFFVTAVLLFLLLFESAWAVIVFCAACLLLCGILAVLTCTWVKIKHE